MQKIFSLFGIGILTILLSFGNANAYKLLSSKELGKDEAKNQNVIVKCTTDSGKISDKTCSLRRYKKCVGSGNNKKCDAWQSWKNLQSPSQEYSSWQAGALDCCESKGLR